WSRRARGPGLQGGRCRRGCPRTWIPGHVKGLVCCHCPQDRGGRRRLEPQSDADVAAAAARMAKLAPEVLVERMVTGAVAELIVGLKSDPQFGPALVVGAGGVLTELLKDTVTLLLPTS